jgi:hypothetical protein
LAGFKVLKTFYTKRKRCCLPGISWQELAPLAGHNGTEWLSVVSQPPSTDLTSLSFTFLAGLVQEIKGFTHLFQRLLKSRFPFVYKAKLQAIHVLWLVVPFGFVPELVFVVNGAVHVLGNFYNRVPVPGFYVLRYGGGTEWI